MVSDHAGAPGPILDGTPGVQLIRAALIEMKEGPPWKRKVHSMDQVSAKETLSRMRAKARDVVVRGQCALQRVRMRMCAKLSDERGQGTTEYAILVGVLVVIAIIAITVFRPKLEELWNAISSGINSL